ncbi:hypothetical protein OSTOST_15566, partial [Ostertagia ostertagi]
MERLAKHLHDLYSKGEYCQDSYEEFVTSEAATTARRFCYDGLRNLPMTTFDELVYARTLDHYAGRIRADILSAQIRKISCNGEVPEWNRPPHIKPYISIRNCTQHWMLEKDPPFVKVGQQ